MGNSSNQCCSCQQIYDDQKSIINSASQYKIENPINKYQISKIDNKIYIKRFGMIVVEQPVTVIMQVLDMILDKQDHMQKLNTLIEQFRSKNFSQTDSLLYQILQEIIVDDLKRGKFFEKINALSKLELEQNLAKLNLNLGRTSIQQAEQAPNQLSSSQLSFRVQPQDLNPAFDTIWKQGQGNTLNTDTKPIDAVVPIQQLQTIESKFQDTIVSKQLGSSQEELENGAERTYIQNIVTNLPNDVYDITAYHRIGSQYMQTKHFIYTECVEQRQGADIWRYYNYKQQQMIYTKKFLLHSYNTAYINFIREVEILNKVAELPNQIFTKIFFKDESKLVISYEAGKCNLEEFALVKYLNKQHWQEQELFYILFSLVSFVVSLQSIKLVHGDIKPKNIVLIQIQPNAYQLRFIELEGVRQFEKEEYPYITAYNYQNPDLKLNSIMNSSEIYQHELYNIARTLITLVCITENMANSQKDLLKNLQFFQNHYTIISSILEQLLKINSQNYDLSALVTRLNNIKGTSIKLQQDLLDYDQFIEHICQSRKTFISIYQVAMANEVVLESFLDEIQFSVLFNEYERGLMVVNTIDKFYKQQTMVNQLDKQQQNDNTYQFYTKAIKIIARWFGIQNIYYLQINVKWIQFLIQVENYNDAILYIKDILSKNFSISQLIYISKFHQLLGQIYFRLGQKSESYDSMKQSLLIQRQYTQSQPTLNLAILLSKIGNLCYQIQQLEPASSYLRTSLFVIGLLYEQDMDIPIKSIILADYANLLRIQDDLKQAAKLFKESIEIKERLYQSFNQLETVRLYLELAKVYEKMNQFQDAQKYYLSFLNFVEKNDNDYTAAQVTEAREKIAYCYFKLRQYENVIQLLTKIASEREKAEEENSPQLLQDYKLLAESLFKLDRFQEALQYNLILLQQQESLKGQFDISNSQLLNNIAIIYFKQGKYQQAEEYFRKDLQIKVKSLQQDDVQIAKALVNLAQTCLKQNDSKQAIELYKFGLQIKLKQPTQDQLEIQQMKQIISDLENNVPQLSQSKSNYCLLYTSDAADDMQCVDLGGRRIIKKKKKKRKK
eukprot:TRINITY_DN35089_c0_g1_i2.p1 TRINITY_DN35089_c0_g1~~TRINITY_DN35089_c0_g1_i2.p1  ORF type:complete len:1065 (-),score=157.41 TRINITY_DN35089_c0_g1_i2:89-3283(-)